MFGKTTLFFLLFLWTQDLVHSLRLVKIRVPSPKREGGKALLSCQYDLQGDTLYNVKWYKDGHEFYRYVPKNDPPVSYFPMAGVKVDVDRSTSNTVALVNLSQESSGNYSCEVNGDAPRFDTVSGHKYLDVFLLPKSDLRIEGLKDKYEVNELLVVNCTLPPSRPKPHMIWFLNHREAPDSFLSGPWYQVSAERPDAVETILQLNFNVTSDFNNGPLRLKCQAVIPPMYYQKIEATREVVLPPTEAKETERR
ncbi:hypothetical protein PYW07_002390 [Mythimna separata]|uniref:Ig-like domain-containing protein n=1 Tax=Mythimna separata TaxID=271217 RepID=A0AAD8DTD9_MYTSE|nr:hypothetical protein PYW07_002390 [Mythimna separata]